MKTVLTRLPFEGFYDSYLTGTIEYWNEFTEIEREFDKEIIAKLWCDMLKGRDALDTEVEFVELDSPMFYNFRTDYLFGKINFEWLEETFNVIDLDLLAQYITDKMGSREGFTSFYDEFVENWKTKPLSDWDENELGCLVECWFFNYTDAETKDGYYDLISTFFLGNGNIAQAIKETEDVY